MRNGGKNVFSIVHNSLDIFRDYEWSKMAGSYIDRFLENFYENHRGKQFPRVD